MKKFFRLLLSVFQIVFYGFTAYVIVQMFGINWCLIYTGFIGCFLLAKYLTSDEFQNAWWHFKAPKWFKAAIKPVPWDVTTNLTGSGESPVWLNPFILELLIRMGAIELDFVRTYTKEVSGLKIELWLKANSHETKPPAWGGSVNGVPIADKELEYVQALICDLNQEPDEP